MSDPVNSPSSTKTLLWGWAQPRNSHTQ